MTDQSTKPTAKTPTITAEHIKKIADSDMNDVVDATQAAINAGGGFGWVKMPSRDVLERYWNGVIMVPHRDLFVGRVDGTIAGTAQLIRQPSNNQAQAFMAKMISVFVSPWARGHGVGKVIIAAVEEFALKKGVEVIRLDVRDTQTHAIQLFEECGYTRWGTNTLYAKVGDDIIPGHYYHKNLTDA